MIPSSIDFATIVPFAIGWCVLFLAIAFWPAGVRWFKKIEPPSFFVPLFIVLLLFLPVTSNVMAVLALMAMLPNAVIWASPLREFLDPKP